jgi:hypothetical protein
MPSYQNQRLGKIAHNTFGDPTIRLMSLAALRDYKLGPFFARLEGAGGLATSEELRCHVRL